jgi:hypothetical protein
MEFGQDGADDAAVADDSDDGTGHGGIQQQPGHTPL